MKLPIILFIIVAVSGIIGLLQHWELYGLQERTDELQRSPVFLAARDSETIGLRTRSPGADGPEETALSAEQKIPERSSDARKAAAILRKAEELMAGEAQIEAAVQLMPRLALASRGVLKEILAQMNSTNLSVNDKAMGWQMILLKLAKKEPRESVELSFQSGFPSVFGEVFGEWIKRDPEAAVAWYEEQVSSGEFPTEQESFSIYAEENIVALIAKSDLGAAFDRIAATGGEEKNKQRRMLGVLRKSIADADDWFTVAQRVSQLEEGWLRTTAFSNYLSPQAYGVGNPRIPIDQITKIDQLDLTQIETSVFARSVLNLRASRSSPELRDWALARLQGDDIGVVRNFYRLWGNTDPAAAQTWADALPDGPIRDAIETE